MGFNAIRVRIASPEAIRSWSHGEVTRPETINYRSFKPERDGLFCERIFGPEKDWECHCGKYKRRRYEGVICDKCGVEVTRSKVRRERMGHIELAVPVAHIWFVKSIPSKIGYLLDMSVSELERVIYYDSYVVLDPGNAPLDKKDLLSEDEVLELREKGYTFKAEIGAGALRSLLKEINIEDLSAELRTQVKIETSSQRKQDLLKRLKVVEGFRQSGNRPEWMILEVLPVLPPDLRPLIPLEGGRFATSDLNDLYRRVINRNNRLKKLMQIGAPEIILRNEKRMLQEAVDALLDNSRRSSATQAESRKTLKSLSELIRGKQGRFRQNLLGKRVDYSGRSVIVVGPELKLYQCGLPKEMALELFKPFVIRLLVEKGLAQTVKSAKRLIERRRSEVWGALEEVIQDCCVLLNRAPTLHRLGIQAFEPVLVEEKAIKIHPLVCAAFNADFDGDQMAVHIPLSVEAQIEARVLMLSSKNVLLPASGKPIIIDKPQDIALGCYYLTKMKPNGEGEGKIFSNPQEALLAYEHGKIGLNAKIKVRIDGALIETTVGRIIFNQILPRGCGFVNKLMDKNQLQEITASIYRELGATQTVEFVDKLKDLGFHYATKAGVTFGIDDLIIPPEKQTIVKEAMKEVAEIQEQYSHGLITDSERYNKIIDIWTHATNDVSQTLLEGLSKDKDGFNPVFMMADSGARGSQEQIRQLAGMRGLMSRPQRKVTGGVGEIIESPIISNFREGLSVLEYFISTHGTRKGLADTALKTAEAGYLTRKLVDVAQDVTVTEEDCGTIRGIRIEALKDGEEVVEPLFDRILGRVLSEDVADPFTGEIIASAGEEITEEVASRITDAGIESVGIRSVLTCESRKGVCVKCYGRNLATGKLVNVGEAVGIIAAQSIGEPGTQLTLRTFHVGGTASRIAEQSEIRAKRAGKVQYKDINYVSKNGSEPPFIVVGRNGYIELLDEQERVRGKQHVPYGAQLLVKEGEKVEKAAVLFRWDPYNNVILTDRAGRAKFVDIKDGVTMREELDEITGLRQRVVVEQRDRSLSPCIEIVDSKGNRLRNYSIPVGARLLVHDKQMLSPGDTLVKIPRTMVKTKDITGGLPRVTELFEGRVPKSPAIVTEIDGEVKIGGLVRGSREIIVTGETGEQRTYLIPYGKHLVVHDGDHVTAGEKLSEGPVNPHDILAILGPLKVAEYLVNEIQEVYRMQGVRINDKHIEIIVRQMLQKVKIVDPGDTNFLEGERVNRWVVAEENERITAEGGKPATYDVVLLGITRAALMTDSFISAASFQETTRVLADAAVQGKTDTLAGLKENVIVGRLIPAGTGALRYRRVSFVETDNRASEETTTEKSDITPQEPPASATSEQTDKQEVLVADHKSTD
ncbi:MAG: DNA-directed RNA polymerase subunit beta' [Candidatus Latescibacteria bacterium]|nr:DNA-directed RNA polymerase subunit beta' [Candidatus Latescibacterota bacterium]